MSEDKLTINSSCEKNKKKHVMHHALCSTKKHCAFSWFRVEQNANIH